MFPRRLLRAAVTWLGLSAMTAGVAILTAPELRVLAGSWQGDTMAETPWERLLVWGAAIALSACAVWLWAGATAVLVQAVRGSVTPVPGCPEVWRRLVLVAGGLAVAGSLSMPAHAADPTRWGGSDPSRSPSSPPATSQALDLLLDGLPLPDRAPVEPPAPAHASPVPRTVSTVPTSRPEPVVRTGRRHVIATGDTLWDIAASTLPGGASNQEIATRWRQIYADNRAVIGPDPDLIHPGHTLRLPGA